MKTSADFKVGARVSIIDQLGTRNGVISQDLGHIKMVRVDGYNHSRPVHVTKLKLEGDTSGS